MLKVKVYKPDPSGLGLVLVDEGDNTILNKYSDYVCYGEMDFTNTFVRLCKKGRDKLIIYGVIM